MQHFVKLRQAAELTNLSLHELRAGVASGKYPAMRAGGIHGGIPIDLDMLNAQITELMEQNCKRNLEDKKPGHIRRIDY